MKKKLLKLFAWIAGFIVIIAILNTEVTTKQGINYKIYTLKIPLYLKILDFLDRNYNYKELVERIINEDDNDEVRIMKIFNWTYQNIRKQPESLPIIDDHVWYTIIRGYGGGEQSSDVFTTLCHYAGLNAFYSWISDRAHTHKIVLSFVKTNGRWVILDQFRGVYFKNKEGDLADIEEIKNVNYVIKDISGVRALDFDYKDYFANLPDIKDMGSSRGGIQSPLKRFIFEIKKMKGKKQK